MAQILFKRLCNINFWHEYYLPGNSGSAYFDLMEDEQQEALAKTFFNQRYRFGQDVAIVPTAVTKRLLKDYRIKFANTPQGLVLGCSVKEAAQADDSIRYRPQITIPADLRLDFQLKLINPTFLTFTNSRLQTTLPTRYLFTNNDPTGEKTFPFLPLPTPVFDATYVYEPGEAALLDGTRQQAVRRTSGTIYANWISKVIAGAASEADRLLLPMRFNFRLPAPSQDLTIRLEDLAGNDFGSPLELTYDAPRTDFLIPLDELELAATDPPFSEQPLRLILEAPSFNHQQTVIIDDDRYDAQSYGTLSVYLRPASGFPLLDDDGFLITQIDAVGQTIDAPQLEVRMEARPTIWRYRSRFGGNLVLETGLSTLPEVEEVAGSVETKKPLPYRYQPQIFTATIGGLSEDVLLPNPVPKYFQEQNGRFVTDIYINGITSLINET